jgi:hypothetical protein
LVTEIAETVGFVREKVCRLEPRRSFVMEWIEPLKNAGHWIPELVEAAGAGRSWETGTGEPQ